MFTSFWFWLAVAVVVFIVISMVKKGREPKKEVAIPASVSLPGKKAIVVVRVEEGSTGRIRIEGEEWLAQDVHGKAIEVGTYVTIIQLQEYKLLVEPIPATS